MRTHIAAASILCMGGALAAGQLAGVLIMPSESFAALERDGVVVAGSVRDLGGLGEGGYIAEKVASADSRRRRL